MASRKKSAGSKRKWSLTKGTKLYKECRKHMELLEGGTMLCIDPSCGSTGSMPGYAIYKAGKLEDSGIIEIPNVSRDLPYRLQDLLKVLQEDFDRPDILVTEAIAPRRFGGGGATGHASLLRSTGVVLAAYHDLPVLAIRPQAWRKMPHEGWFKDDEQDAIAFGHCALEVCRRITNGDIGK